MKKSKRYTCILLMILALTITWLAGKHHGLTHAIEDSVIWVTTSDDCWTINIELDGEHYTHEYGYSF